MLFDLIFATICGILSIKEHLWILKLNSKHISSYIVLFISSVFLLLLFYAQTEYMHNRTNFTVVYSEDGVYDLREFDLSTTLIALDGNVEHIEGAMLTPSEFTLREGEAEIGDPIDTDTGRTARLTMLMPSDKNYMFIAWGDYARTIFVNGEFVNSTGTPAVTAEDFNPQYKKMLIQAPATDNTLQLVIQGANFVHREGSSYHNVIISEPELMLWYTNFGIIIEVLSAGICLTLFLIYLIMGIISKNYKINIYFSLLSLIWFFRLGLIGNKFLYNIFPDFPWVVAIKTEYITLTLTVILLIYITRYHVHDMLNVKPLLSASYVFIALSLLFLFLDTKSMSYFIYFINAAFIGLIAYVTIGIILWLLKKDNRRSVDFSRSIVIVSMVFLFICAVSDGLYYININLFNNTLAETGIIVFAVFQAIALFYINVREMERSRSEERMMRIRSLELERFLKMKSHFIGIVAHEIKTPLSIIMGSASDTLDIIDDGDKSSLSEIRYNQSLIKDTVQKVNETVFDLLDTTALETGRLSLDVQKTSLCALIVDVTEQYKNEMEKSNNQIVLNLKEDCLPILADKNRLQQVLLNLLSNACRHTTNGVITIGLHDDEEYQYVTIDDNGEGMSNEVLNKLKNEYVDGGPHGYRGGIGIYVSNQIVISHGGELTITSQEGKGTKVTVKLPM